MPIPLTPLAAGVAASDTTAARSQVFAVFGQRREGSAMAHLGMVKAATAAEAAQLAQIQHGTHTSGAELWLAPAHAIGVTPWVADTETVYDLLEDEQPPFTGPEPDESVLEAEAYARGEEDYAIFHQQAQHTTHVHAGLVRAAAPAEALQQAKAIFGPTQRAVNVWVVRWADIRTSETRTGPAAE